MEYAINISDDICNDQFVKHIGFSDYVCLDDPNASCMEILFSQDTRMRISKKITELLMGVDKKNTKPILVPDKTICSILSTVYENSRPETSDIYSRYNIPVNRGDWIQRMIDQTINIIVSNVKDTIQVDENNSKLSTWVQVLGNFNEHGLRSHPPIKLRERRPQPFLFQMHY